jgi:uncharacterized protein (DUF983 family)
MRGGFGPPFVFAAGTDHPEFLRSRSTRGRPFSRSPPLPEVVSPPSPTTVGLKGCCPRCGKGKLFQGFLSLRPACEACGLDYTFIDTADGPAFFVMSFVGIVVVGLAMWVEFAFEPAVWLHLVLWFSLTAILSLVLVRPSKGIMVALQFRNKAEEGRLQR